LCDRIALIQKGKILKIESPSTIIKDYDKIIYDIRAKNMHQLIQKKLSCIILNCLKENMMK